MDANTPVSALKILTSHPLKLSSSGLPLPQFLRLFLLQDRCPIPLLGGYCLTCWLHSISGERDDKREKIQKRHRGAGVPARCASYWKRAGFKRRFLDGKLAGSGGR